MADTDRLAKELAGIIRGSGSRQTKAYDTPATVRRVDGSTAWVHIPGGVDETPVQLTIAAEVGDTVQVRVSGGTAWMVGNASAPPTDDRVAVAAREKADEAAQVAEAAETLGTEAREVARAAAKIAGDTDQHFWVTETGADTGAHITEKTKDDFLADPDNGGGNLLARSNGIALRDGLIELATLQQSGMDVNTYTGGGTIVNIAHLGYGPGNDDQGGTSDDPYYSFGVRVGTVGNYSVSEGDRTEASGYASHAEGWGVRVGDSFVSTTASGNASHAEGIATLASGNYSHAEGYRSEASGLNAHAEGAGSVASGDASHAQNTGTVADQASQTAIGLYNTKNNTNNAFVIGNGIADANRSDALTVDWSGLINAGTTAGINTALSTLGWTASAKTADGLLKIQTTLEKLLDRLALYDKSLSMSVASWTTGNCTVTGSSKYRVFEVVQGGASCIAIRYGNSVRGFAISGNASSGNYNQYIRAFGATANWSTEVWTMEWAKQLSHVTSSGYHTSGAEQAITEIRGLIPLQNA